MSKSLNGFDDYNTALDMADSLPNPPRIAGYSTNNEKANFITHELPEVTNSLANM